MKPTASIKHIKVSMYNYLTGPSYYYPYVMSIHTITWPGHLTINPRPLLISSIIMDIINQNLTANT